MPFNIQAKILRLLQEKRIERLGAYEAIPVDVRIIAATNRDLEAALREGRFREDLYYRLKVVTLRLPPLYERLDDIPFLTDYFVARFSNEMGTDNPGITKKAMTFLSGQHWPGNVRELANTIQKALIFNRGGPISREDMAQATARERVSVGTDSTTDEVIRQWVRKALTYGTAKPMFNSVMDDFAKVIITETLKLTSGNRTRAAELLGISRPTLLARIEKYGLKIEASIKSNRP